MTEQREFIDGAFYWAKRGGGRTVAECEIVGDEVCWSLPAFLGPSSADFLVERYGSFEIGPLIGKEPPRGSGPRKAVLVGQHSGEGLEYVLPVSPDNLAGRSDERAAILAYLRAKSERRPTGSMFHMALTDAAEAIERGDHLKDAND